MFSRWRDALRHALALRLGLWYAGLFAVSAVALLLATYLLLARALAQQDHDVLASMLTRYASEYQRAGLPGLRRMVELDASEGRHERLLVRVAGRAGRADLLRAAARVGRLRRRRLDGRGASSTWATLANPRDRSALEVGTARLPDGILVQVGRSSHVRDELLANFRAAAFTVGAILALIAAIGAVVITTAALAPLRSMEATASIHPADPPLRRPASRPAAPPTRSTGSGRASTRCWRRSRRRWRACAARSTTSPTTCARR